MRILALRSRIDDGPGSDLADEVLNSGVLEQKNKVISRLMMGDVTLLVVP